MYTDTLRGQWLIAMWTRLGWAVISMLLISNFPQSGISNSYFFLVVACTVGSSFSRSVATLSVVVCTETKSSSTVPCNSSESQLFTLKSRIR